MSVQTVADASLLMLLLYVCLGSAPFQTIISYRSDHELGVVLRRQRIQRLLRNQISRCGEPGAVWTATHHQLREHPVQLVVARHGQCRFHGLQGEVLAQSVGDLRVLTAVEAAEDEGQATAAATAATALPRGHGSVRSGQGGEGWGGGEPLGSCGALVTASVRDDCERGDGKTR